MLPSTAEVAFGGVIIYQRQRQLSLIQLLNTCIAADKNSRRFLWSRLAAGPAEPTEGSGGWWWWWWWWWGGPCQWSPAVVIFRRSNANPAVVRRGLLGLGLPVPNPSLKGGWEGGRLAHVRGKAQTRLLGARQKKKKKIKKWNKMEIEKAWWSERGKTVSLILSRT